ncbi:hypothetical protein VNO77_12058 [Canavalia gladiata]|uniref:Uncharacterized protein n=1 Tax=Canavalia gladiata TaxID=3824 RepID=A0AAN9LVU9_CANGL
MLLVLILLHTRRKKRGCVAITSRPRCLTKLIHKRCHFVLFDHLDLLLVTPLRFRVFPQLGLGSSRSTSCYDVLV